MGRYPKGSGARPNQRNKSKTASGERANQTSKTDTRVATERPEANTTQLNDQSAPPQSPLSNMISEAERQAQLNQIKTQEIEQKEDKKIKSAQNSDSEEPFDAEKTLKIAELRKPMINFVLESTEPVLIHVAKDERGGWLPDVKDNFIEGFSLFTAIMWPDMDEMDERSKMLLSSLYVIGGASMKQIKHVNKLRKEAIEKGPQKVESNNPAT